MGRVDVKEQAKSYRLSTLDRTDITLISPYALLVARISPYLGWDQLVGRARRDWDVVTKAIGSRKIERIGVRYINRFDIPVSKTEVLNLESYFTIFPNIPRTPLGPLDGYAVHLEMPIGEDDMRVVLNSTSIPSPLFSHASFLLDIDLSRTTDIPTKADALWNVIDRFRSHKNRIFEGSITDEARRLLNA